MKLVETLLIQNEERVWVGRKHIEITFDTDTGQIEFDAPAMFVNPIINIEDLQRVLDRFEVHQGR